MNSTVRNEVHRIDFTKTTWTSCLQEVLYQNAPTHATINENYCFFKPREQQLLHYDKHK